MRFPKKRLFLLFCFLGITITAQSQISSASDSIVMILVQEPDEVIEVLSCDKPYENRLDYATILFDGDKYVMYYRAINPKSISHASHCYATSLDGIHWTKPDLGLVEYDGDSHNNIISDAFMGISVEKANGGYFLLSDRKFFEERDTIKCDKNLELYKSSNGTEFAKCDSFIVPFWCDSQNQILWDSYTQSFKLFLRSWYKSDNSHILYNHNFYYRSVSYVETQDPQHFTINDSTPFYHRGKDVPPSLNDEIPIIIKNESNEDYDIYNPSVHQYRPNLFVAYPTLYYHWPSKKKAGKIVNDGYGVIGFYVSENGKDFHLVDDRYIDSNQKWIEFAIGHIETETQFIHYYITFLGTHGTHSQRNSIIARIHNK